MREASQDFAAERERMVLEQIAKRGVTDPAVLEAMGKVPREQFVPAALRAQAYADHPLGIGYGQTISQPFIVALMTELGRLRPRQRVLEVGTGSGYQTAVLAQLGVEVFTTELVESLARCARETITRLGLRNVHTRCGDGSLGWPEHQPYDAILVTCAAGEVPDALVAQLRIGGRLVVPVGPEGAVQMLQVITRRAPDQVIAEDVIPVVFVPLRH